MKSVMLGIGAMIVIGVVAWAVMGTYTEGSDEAFLSPNNSVRLN